MFIKRYGHYFDYLIMIIKDSRHPKLCFYCLKSCTHFFTRPCRQCSFQFQPQNARCRPKHHMRFSITSTTSLAWRTTSRYSKWRYWRNRAGILITNWFCIIHFRCITSIEISKISLWVHSGISPWLMPTQRLGC